jgi:anaerobic magnesium-protoporphyrin IX monomethyl ester cyclase
MTFWSFKDENRETPQKPTGLLAEDKHTATLAAIQKYSKPAQKGLQDLTIDYNVNRSTRICLAVLPEWDPSFPPYNIAKLASAVKRAGYACKSFDINVDAAWRYEKEKWDIEFNPWDPLRDWHWYKDPYYKDIHPHLEPIMLEYVERIVEFKPDVIGFSLYYCNEEPTKWMAFELRKRLPNIKIIVGGPATHASYYKGEDVYDYVVNGEGEQPLLLMLASIENKKQIEYTEQGTSKIIRQPEEQRYNLSTLPFPDYSDFDFSKYKFPNGALLEISRGCIAKCTFCEETHFWKYRQRTALSTINEVEHMYYEHGTNVFWFIDSLVNGNLNELRAFVKGVAEKELDIHWTGYCRCDGRMDAEFFKDLRAGGCEVLNYGIESGSQPVLDLMDKKVTVEEMEANFRDGHAAGIQAMTNWIVGFPNEGPKELEDTFTFLWRMRNFGITNIAQGTGFSVGVDTIVGQNFDKFNLLPFYYYDHWMTKDMRMSIVHKLIRMKSFSIFTDFLQTDLICSKPTRHNLAKKHYKIVFNDPNRLNNDLEYDYDEFDYNIIKPGISNFADSLVNEIWPFLRMLWRTRGGYKLQLLFKKEWEYEEWGARNAAPLNATYNFEIDDNGNWNANFDWDYQQDQYTNWEDKYWIENGHQKMAVDPWSPVWAIMDFTRDNSNAAIRSRKLAWKGDDTKKHLNPESAWDRELFKRNEREFLSLRNLDLSFKYKWQGNGKWDK